MSIPYSREQVRAPDWSRLEQADAPRLAAMVPDLNRRVPNANVTLDKQIATLYRAGSAPGNPVLSGLGIRIQHIMGQGDRFLGLYIFQDLGAPRANLVSQVAFAGQIATFDFRAGAGLSVGGTTVAALNYLRVATESGTFEKQFYIKRYDADIVTLNGQAGLDASSLLPVELALDALDPSRDWIDVDVDFMPSWNDEFQVLARGDGSQQAEAGFKKAYGGALFVSFFDTDPGTEGVGVQVNPITKANIYTQRTIQIENTEGLKEFTARFRSEQDSSFFVDVPLKIRVGPAPEDNCSPPFSTPCSEVYLKAGTALPVDCPAVASIPGEQVVAGTEGASIVTSLLVVTLHGTSVGASPKIRVIKRQWIADAKAVAGGRLQDVGSPEEYLPLILDGTTPVEAPPYGDPKRLTIAFSVPQLQADQVAILSVAVKDGDHTADPVDVTGPAARGLGIMPIGGTGNTGDDLCAY